MKEALQDLRLYLPSRSNQNKPLCFSSSPLSSACSTHTLHRGLNVSTEQLCGADYHDRRDDGSWKTEAEFIRHKTAKKRSSSCFSDTAEKKTVTSPDMQIFSHLMHHENFPSMERIRAIDSSWSRAAAVQRWEHMMGRSDHIKQQLLRPSLKSNTTWHEHVKTKCARGRCYVVTVVTVRVWSYSDWGVLMFGIFKGWCM